ncbi:MAG: right-handed parallel beta-helix repeat-containing protein [Planctomycetota bacterium]|jgi:hypothetical protein
MRKQFIIGIFCLCVGLCLATTWTVNLDGSGDFTDIQSAINAAGPGDIVEVADGIYSGTGNQNISFLGKAITVKSINGPDACIVEGDNTTPSFNRGFIFEAGEIRDSILEGITIRNFRLSIGFDYDSGVDRLEGGAGIYIADGDPTIQRCKILDCSLYTEMYHFDRYGAGIYVEAGSPLIDHCVLRGNFGAYKGGGIACNNEQGGGAPLVFLNNCIVTDNSADNGGGIYMYYFLEAYVEEYGTDTIQKKYFLGKHSISWWSPVPAQTRGPVLGDNVNYIQGDPLATEVPQFVDPANNDYHLQWNSPCIDFCIYDTCNPALIDIDNEPRCMGQYVDAGADEVGPKQADFSRNGKIDLIDFEIFSSAWGTTSSDADWYLLCDLAEDDFVDLSDLQQLCTDWLWQTDWYE